MTQPERIAQQLREYLERKQWTQIQLAEATGVHQAQVSQILRGHFVRATGNVAALCKYANIATAAPKQPRKLSEKVQQVLAEIVDGDPKREKALLSFVKAGARFLNVARRGE
jgi:transcriptional regulator with XRE-family HTH domain